MSLLAFITGNSVTDLTSPGRQSNYELTPDAEADLKGIAEYTLRQWGAAQQERYAELLEAGFRRIRDKAAYHCRPA
jgi:plasmid stabilization system protein ParE